MMHPKDARHDPKAFRTAIRLEAKGQTAYPRLTAKVRRSLGSNDIHSAAIIARLNGQRP